MDSRDADVANIGAGTAGLNARREVEKRGGRPLPCESAPAVPPAPTATGLQLDDVGLPAVDPDTAQSGNAPIFMAGDVANSNPLLHAAADEG